MDNFDLSPPEPNPAPRAVRKTVCVDVGHGGDDQGGRGVGGVREAPLVLPYGLDLAAELKRRGFNVLITRTKDAAVTKARRAAIANDARADAFVSIHMDASAAGSTNGSCVFHAEGSVRGRALARAVWKAFWGDKPATGMSGVFPDDSPRCGDRKLAVLRRTKMPAILIELGFMTNRDELRRMQDETWRARAVDSIADGIEDWLEV